MAAHRIVSNLHILALFFLCLVVTTTSDDPSFYYPSKFGSSTPHEYTRFADVERHCQSVLSSAADFTVGADRVPFPMDSLSFMNGDWSQDAGQAPLLPFQGSHADASVAGRSQQLEPVNLASFLLTHVEAEPRGGSRRALNVSGLLTMAITRNCCCSSMDPHGPWPELELELQHGVSKLRVQFEGVYTETRMSSGAVTSGGERVLCMVGNSVLPMRSCNSSDPWGWTKKNHCGGSGTNLKPPPVMAADNILLVLRYPKTRTLAARAVHGEMVTTSTESGGAYFDKVRLVSRLHSYYSHYQFRPEHEELEVAAGCSEQPSLGDGDGDGVGHWYRGAFFCEILRQFAAEDYGVMDVAPNSSPLGLFETKGAATATPLARPAVVMQGLECSPTFGKGARVSAVFRLVSPWEDQPTAAKRTGLGDTTLSGEGVWSASTGRLCMVACRGLGTEACHHRVTLHVPTSFSITRRSIVVGQITAMDGSHSPVSFRRPVSPRHHWQQFDGRGETLRMAYNYTKINHAIELLRQSKPSLFRDSLIARSFLSYPDVAGGATDDTASLSILGEDLGLRFQCSARPAFVPEWIEEPFFQLQILSVGSLVGSYDPPYQPVERGMRFEQQLVDRRLGLEKQQGVLNVSAVFTASGSKFFDSRPVMSLEGVYNPDDGRMHLVGCRDVYAPSPSSSGLEDGMDCSIKVTVEYPPTTTRWLISPVAKVRVASTRDAADPLHFNRTELRSLPIIYRDQRHEATEPKVEGVLCVAVLSAATAATVIQLRHVRSHADVAPYVSLATLGVQALGYGATLVLDARTLPAWPTSGGGRYRGYYPGGDHLQWGVDCAVKALTLAALLLTARLAQKVWRSRARVEPGRVPNDGVVLVCSVVVYLGGLLFVLVVHWISTDGTPRTLPPGVPDYGYQEYAHRRMLSRTAVVERYFGAAKEWFLIPQVIGNAVWRVNSRPLAVRYYAGVTAAWLLPHVYGYLRPPVVHHYMNPGEAQHGGVSDFYSKAVAVVVPVVGVLLVLAVYVQQRWNYMIVGWVPKGEQNKRQHVY